MFVYLFDEDEPHKRNVADRLVSHALHVGESVISYQVVQETLNVITKKVLVPATVEQADIFLVGTLLPLCKINPSHELYRRGLHIQARYQYSFYDSLIIAAALELGCTTLLSEDMQHGQQIERLAIENPFLH